MPEWSGCPWIFGNKGCRPTHHRFAIAWDVGHRTYPGSKTAASSPKDSGFEHAPRSTRSPPSFSGPDRRRYCWKLWANTTAGKSPPNWLSVGVQLRIIKEESLEKQKSVISPDWSSRPFARIGYPNGRWGQACLLQHFLCTL